MTNPHHGKVYTLRCDVGSWELSPPREDGRLLSADIVVTEGNRVATENGAQGSLEPRERDKTENRTQGCGGVKKTREKGAEER